ncbi:MAG TPA: hypothetical protein VE090_00040 [Methylomirabilota bacterium]|nr:hypothetical protein [Methylomirabilota bacterium]
MGVRDQYTYTPVKKFTELTSKGKLEDKEITVNLTGLSHEELIALGVKVGFETESYRQFEYKSYEEWANELGTRAKTKEEKRKKLQ